VRKLIPILALAVAGCQDLAVTNPNLPDRSRATLQPTATEAFVAGAFRTWWPVAGHDEYPAWAYSTMAREITSGFADFGQLELSAEPRSGWNNSPLNAREDVNVEPWFGLYRTLSTVNDAVRAIDSGLVIVNAERTTRAEAVGRFMQGISTGYLGLYFDQAVIVDETQELDPDNVIRLPFSPYPAVVATAIEQLDKAITVAGTRDFDLPPTGWLFQELTRNELIQLANSYVARLMVYQARTPAERADVDWAEVERRINAGITFDFAPVAEQDVLFDDWKRLVARLRTTGRPSDFGRPSYWLLGPADASNGFIDWVETDLNDREGFQITTSDRRIQGSATDPAAPGTYVGYNDNDIFAASRGTYRFSHYYFLRYGTGTSWQSGSQPEMLRSEMDLLKAEALIRLGRAGEAVPLINKTREANGKLPPVDINGPPVASDCVPRKLDGTCGSLWDALRYEKKIEGLGVTGVIAFFDARGWGELPENTPVHFPVPGSELENFEMPNYTFGGPGGTASAAPPVFDRCPTGVTLPRC
jgi:hypothetical protein